MLNKQIIATKRITSEKNDKLFDFDFKVKKALNEIGSENIISVNFFREHSYQPEEAIITYKTLSVVSLIVAKSTNDVIGKNNQIPWHCSRDLKLFKELTTGNVVIMGRNTFESIGSKPLPNRVNIVLTSDPSKMQIMDHVLYRTNLEEAILDGRIIGGGKEVFIIGGYSLYYEALKKDLLHRLYISYINKEVLYGDKFFPVLIRDTVHFTPSEEVICYPPTHIRYKCYQSDVYHSEELGEEKSIEFTAKRYERFPFGECGV